jgi:hypothetical protein
LKKTDITFRQKGLKARWFPYRGLTAQTQKAPFANLNSILMEFRQPRITDLHLRVRFYSKAE